MNPQKTILIAEDEASIRSIVRKELEKDGIAILEASNGEEAQKIAFKEKPDLILLDFLMPKMHGMEVLNKLREDEWGKTVPVIFLTNFDDDPKLKSAVNAGRCSMISKGTSDLATIINTIKSRLRE